MRQMMPNTKRPTRVGLLTPFCNSPLCGGRSPPQLPSIPTTNLPRQRHARGVFELMCTGTACKTTQKPRFIPCIPLPSRHQRGQRAPAGLFAGKAPLLLSPGAKSGQRPRAVHMMQLGGPASTLTSRSGMTTGRQKLGHTPATGECAVKQAHVMDHAGTVRTGRGHWRAHHNACIPSPCVEDCASTTSEQLLEPYWSQSSLGSQTPMLRGSRGICTPAW